MKKVLSVVAVSAFVLAASAAIAGGPGKKTGPGCPDACQGQIDQLQSKQAMMGEQMQAQGKELDAQGAQIKGLGKQGEVYNPWYVKVSGRWAMTADPEIVSLIGLETDDGYGFGGSVGRQFGQFRVEGEIATQKSDLAAVGIAGISRSVGSGDLRIDTAMVNGFYEFPVADGFGIYAMAGMGIANATVSIYDADDSETTFAWKAGAGVSWAFADEMAVDFGYEYLGVSDITVDNYETSDIASHNILAAFRYMF